MIESPNLLRDESIQMKQGHHYYVYILECSDRSYYTGITNNIDRRLWEHETGFNTKCYTFNRRPLILKYCIHFTDVKSAILWEKQIKGWSRKKKEALFEENWEEVKRLSRAYKDIKVDEE